MTKKQWVALGLTILAAFAFGRWSAPDKIKTVEVEKQTSAKDSEADRNKHKDTTVTEKVNSDGSKETTTHTVEDTEATKKTSESSISESTREKDVEKTSSKVTISVLAGTSLMSPQITYGASVYRPVLGPIGIGVWGLQSGTFGASIGISF